MTIDKFHKIIKDVCRKEQVFFPGDGVIDDYADRTQMELFEEELPQYGQGQPNVDSLAPFKKSYQFTYATSPNGLVTLPTDYLHLNAGSYTTVFDNDLKRNVRCDIHFEQDDKLTDAINCQVRVVSKTWVVAELTGSTVQLYPQEPQTGIIRYFKRPAVPKFAYTLSGADGRTVTYDQANSTQLEWNDAYINRIILKTLGLLGITYGEQELTQYAEIKQKQP